MVGKLALEVALLSILVATFLIAYQSLKKGKYRVSRRRMNKVSGRSALLLSGFMLASLWLNNLPGLYAAENSRYFPQTGHTVSGKFLSYWNDKGGLPTFGYPITEAQNEIDPETGKTYQTQWFERNRFELHPENAGSKFEVLLGLLGKDLKREALKLDPDFQRALAFSDPAVPKNSQWYFEETGHNLRFRFLEYWLANGGLERFGYPLSEEYREVDPETGQVFLVQWFERARFEFHPENGG